MSAKEMRIAEKSTRTSRHVGERQWSRKNPRGFTLIELLVVISILVLLMGILLPTLQQVRKQAKAVVCQANLRQWGVAFSMYMNEYNDRLDSYKWSMVPWWRWGRWYYADCNDLLLCPMATRYELNKNDPAWEGAVASGWGKGSKFTAWRANENFADWVFYGSYGTNLSAPTIIYAPSPSTRRSYAEGPGRSNVPFFLDCAVWTSYATTYSEPPAYDGDLAPVTPPSNNAMKYFCIDRHDGTINSLFLDWSVRPVGLKELWALKWWGRYNTHGPWTRAGGVQAEDWPAWMRHFKDY